MALRTLAGLAKSGVVQRLATGTPLAATRLYHEKVRGAGAPPRRKTKEERAPATLRSLYPPSRLRALFLCGRLTSDELNSSPFPVFLSRAQVIDHYENPRNVGSFDKNDKNVGTGLVGAPACGDVMKLQIKVDDDGNIIDSCFKTFGCGSAIASSSVATEW